MHLAQLNIAQAIETMDHPMMADFMANVDRINSLAEISPGFVWRYIEDEHTLSSIFKPSVIAVNMSVWESKESLFTFVYASNHTEIFKRKAEWFQKMPQMHMVLWYVEEGHIPTVAEANQRLVYIRKHGESEYAFNFKSSF